MAIFGGNGFGGLLGSILGGGAMRSGIAPGDNDWLEEFRKRMANPGRPVGDIGEAPPAPQPQQRGGGFLGGLFGGGGNWGDRLSDIGQRLGAAGAYFDGDWQAGAAINQARAEQEAQRREAMGAQGEQERIYADLIAEGYTPTQARLALLNAKSIGEAAVNKANPKPMEPTATQRDTDWYMRASPEQRAAYDAMHPIITTGPEGQNYVPRSGITSNAPQAAQTYTDPDTGETYRLRPGATNTRDPNAWEKIGGGVGNGTGGFPRRRR